MNQHIEQVWIDEDAAESPVAKEILSKLKHAKILSSGQIKDELRCLAVQPDPLTIGKKTIRLMKHKGAFLKPCPGTPEYICCGLQILHIGQGCPMDCSYCALQVYFNRPVMELFVNHEDMTRALASHIIENPEKFHRICTGEFTDSLALDNLSGLTEKLVPLFDSWANASLEIKTKTDQISALLKMNPKGNIVSGFSVNWDKVCKRDERRAAPLKSRLNAAKALQERGYFVSFHFDPIIPMPGWQEGYAEVVDSIFRTIDPSRLAWISMGVLRFAPSLKEVSEWRFGGIPYFHDGFLRGLDGKMRLHVKRRIEIYRMISDRIRKHNSSSRIYLCMESPYVWEKALGITMESGDDLSDYLDKAFHPK
jgi:spore photoproduct lyase